MIGYVIVYSTGGQHGRLCCFEARRLSFVGILTGDGGDNSEVALEHQVVQVGGDDGP